MLASLAISSWIPSPTSAFARLPVADLRLQRVPLVGRDVRRVRDDQVPAFGRRLQVALSNLDRQVEPLGVLPRERNRILRRVDGGHARVWTFVRDRQRNRPRSGAEVEHARIGLVTQQGKAAFHDDLGLGARDERTRIRVQHQPAEAPLPEDVRQRLALSAPFEQCVELVGDVLVASLVHAGARGSEDVGEKQLGVDPWRVDTRLLEPLLGETESFTDRHCSSARRRSSAPSASVNSSSSPCRTLSS